jgi:hypothetical protein
MRQSRGRRQKIFVAQLIETEMEIQEIGVRKSAQQERKQRTGSDGETVCLPGNGFVPEFADERSRVAVEHGRQTTDDGGYQRSVSRHLLHAALLRRRNSFPLQVLGHPRYSTDSDEICPFPSILCLSVVFCNKTLSIMILFLYSATRPLDSWPFLVFKETINLSCFLQQSPQLYAFSGFTLRENRGFLFCFIL